MIGVPQRGARQYMRSTASAARGHNNADGPRSSFASVDLGAGGLDRLGPSRLLIRDGRRELLGRMWREGLHTELEEQLLEFPGRLNFLELVGETHEDIQWRPRRRDDS